MHHRLSSSFPQPFINNCFCVRISQAYPRKTKVGERRGCYDSRYRVLIWRNRVVALTGQASWGGQPDHVFGFDQSAWSRLSDGSGPRVLRDLNNCHDGVRFLLDGKAYKLCPDFAN